MAHRHTCGKGPPPSRPPPPGSNSNNNTINTNSSSKQQSTGTTTNGTVLRTACASSACSALPVGPCPSRRPSAQCASSPLHITTAETTTPPPPVHVTTIMLTDQQSKTNDSDAAAATAAVVTPFCTIACCCNVCRCLCYGAFDGACTHLVRTATPCTGSEPRRRLRERLAPPNTHPRNTYTTGTQ